MKMKEFVSLYHTAKSDRFLYILCTDVGRRFFCAAK